LLYYAGKAFHELFRERALASRPSSTISSSQAMPDTIGPLRCFARASGGCH
jgi:hypothetical protein